MRALVLLISIGCGTGVPPRGRAVKMQAPHTADEARAAGCWTDAEEISPMLGRAAAEAGGFESYLEPQGAPIRWVIVLEAPWIYGSARQRFSLFLLNGTHLRRDEFQVGEPTQGFRDIWMEEGGWISVQTDSIVLPSLTRDDGEEIPIELSGASFNARLLQDDRGLTIREGALSGVLLQDGLQACLLLDVEPAVIHGPEELD